MIIKANVCFPSTNDHAIRRAKKKSTINLNIVDRMKFKIKFSVGDNLDDYNL